MSGTRPDTGAETPITASDAQIDALLEAAAAGVDFEGMRVESGPDGYTFATTETSEEELDEPALRELAAEHPTLVAEWHFWDATDRPEPEQAFLRWVEGADDRSPVERYAALADGDVTASWGQLRIEVRLGEHGERAYALRHEDDADRELEDLEVHDDPLDARELVTFDDDGRYRPLKTAPSLPNGWAFVDLDGRGLGRAVDVVYPATIANWHLEREGELDVSHWKPTMARQTGIYGVVETWDRGEGHEHVNWVAEACCVDSQCLKRREWDYDEETDLDVDRGDGEFPCREPCSLVVAAARQWTKLEGEEPRTYEFELTPSEKEQLEAIVDAVADGEADEIREADVYEGANRYRARYLRAKLFDDEGNLGGVPTDRDAE